jgi:transposase-like protein
MRRARDIWVQIVRQCEGSGLTHEEFARQRGIPVGTLRSWIYKIRRSEDEVAPLLPVRVVASTPPSAGRTEAVVIEVDVGEAVRLRFPSSTAPSMIAEVVLRLRGSC